MKVYRNQRGFVLAVSMIFLSGDDAIGYYSDTEGHA